jgi:hypothetical protein
VPEDTVHAYSYSKRRRSCTHLNPTRSGWVNGVRLTGRKLIANSFLGCRSLPSAAGMVGDIDSSAAVQWPRSFRSKITLGLHGTNRAGFQDRARFTCRVSKRGDRSTPRYVFDCTNKLGDGFRYSFTVRGPRR